jgi:predicted SprT family Zn-dependent metalloprotease
VLHEIAHALSYVHNKYVGHGDPWKKWCCIVGAKPKTFYDSTNVTPAKYKYHLVDLENKFMTGYHRMPKWGRHIKLNTCETMMVNGKRQEIKLVKIN